MSPMDIVVASGVSKELRGWTKNDILRVALAFMLFEPTPFSKGIWALTPVMGGGDPLGTHREIVKALPDTKEYAAMMISRLERVLYDMPTLEFDALMESLEGAGGYSRLLDEHVRFLQRAVEWWGKPAASIQQLVSRIAKISEA